MKRWDFSFASCMLLCVCVAGAGLTGYLQVQLDLHRFVFHKYLAYASLVLMIIHMAFNWKKITGSLRKLFRR